tara:strand:- start:2719 stop:2973 length:255 start_codon:yes stop_codon:yes gene_type:complete
MTLLRVEGYEIDTKNIVKITDADWRRIGFHIHLVGPRVIKIDRPEPYDMTPMGVRELSRPYEALRDKVEKKWNDNKSQIETICL